MVEYEVYDLGSFGKCIMSYVFDIDTKEYNVAKMRRNKLNEILED